MILGISVAMAGELSTITRTPQAPGSCRALSPEVLLARSGVGAERARAAGEELLEQGATALLSWGTAAGLNPSLPPGSLVIPHEVISASLQVYSVDPAWHERLKVCLAPHFTIHTGPIAASEGVVESLDTKRELLLETEADATDMESGALAELALAREVPFCAIRAIVDPAGMTLPRCVLQAFDQFGEVQTGKLLRWALRHPGEWGSLIRLGRHFAAARRTLRGVIARTGPQFLAF